MSRELKSINLESFIEFGNSFRRLANSQGENISSEELALSLNELNRSLVLANVKKQHLVNETDINMNNIMKSANISRKLILETYNNIWDDVLKDINNNTKVKLEQLKDEIVNFQVVLPPTLDITADTEVKRLTQDDVDKICKQFKGITSICSNPDEVMSTYCDLDKDLSNIEVLFEILLTYINVVFNGLNDIDYSRNIEVNNTAISSIVNMSYGNGNNWIRDKGIMGKEYVELGSYIVGTAKNYVDYISFDADKDKDNVNCDILNITKTKLDIDPKSETLYTDIANKGTLLMMHLNLKQYVTKVGVLINTLINKIDAVEQLYNLLTDKLTSIPDIHGVIPDRAISDKLIVTSVVGFTNKFLNFVIPMLLKEYEDKCKDVYNFIKAHADAMKIKDDEVVIDDQISVEGDIVGLQHDVSIPVKDLNIHLSIGKSLWDE